MAYFLEMSVDGHVLKRAALLLSLAFSRTLSITIILYIDRASQVLAQNIPLDVPRIWTALLERGDVPLTTLYYYIYRRPSIKEKARGQ